MSALPPLLPLPLLRLRCSSSDGLRRLLQRAPELGHLPPGLHQIDGDRARSCYRRAAGQYFVQVHWRCRHGRWEECDHEVVPGAVVALRLVLDHAEPQAITRLLGIAPTRAFAKGDSGLHARQVRDEGLWIHEVPVQGFDWPEQQVAELLARLRGSQGFAAALRLPGVRWAGVTVRLHHAPGTRGGLALELPVLEDLVALALQLDVALQTDD